jgi:hypothetical protein
MEAIEGHVMPYGYSTDISYYAIHEVNMNKAIMRCGMSYDNDLNDYHKVTKQ